MHVTEQSRGAISFVRDAIASRQLSAEEVVRLALDRIGRFNLDLNAVVATRADEAIAEATFSRRFAARARRRVGGIARVAARGSGL